MKIYEDDRTSIVFHMPPGMEKIFRLPNGQWVIITHDKVTNITGMAALALRFQHAVKSMWWNMMALGRKPFPL